MKRKKVQPMGEAKFIIESKCFQTQKVETFSCFREGVLLERQTQPSTVISVVANYCHFFSQNLSDRRKRKTNFCKGKSTFFPYRNDGRNARSRHLNSTLLPLCLCSPLRFPVLATLRGVCIQK